MPRLLLAFVLCCVSSLAVADVKILPDGRVPADKRLGNLKDLNGYFPLEVPATKEEWAKRADVVRKQVLSRRACGRCRPRGRSSRSCMVSLIAMTSRSSEFILRVLRASS